MASIAYVFIRNTGALRYRIAWKKVDDPVYNIANQITVAAVGGDWTTAEVDISPDVDISNYNFIITPICLSSEGPGMPIYVEGICRKVTFTAEWNNCDCPEITNITIENG